MKKMKFLKELGYSFLIVAILSIAAQIVAMVFKNDFWHALIYITLFLVVNNNLEQK